MTSTQSGRESIGNQVRIGGALALLATASVGVAGQPHVLRVDQTAPAGGNGESWAGAFRDIHDALDAARASFASEPTSPVEVRIAHGTYKPDRGTGDRSKFYDASVPVSMMTLSLIGAFAGLGGADPDRRDLVGTRTVISGDLQGNDTPGFGNRGDNSRSLLQASMRSGWITIEGIEFQGSNQDEDDFYAVGAAVRIASAAGYLKEARFKDCQFRQNRSQRNFGAALWTDAILASARGCTFDGNRAENGMGSAIYSAHCLNVASSTFANNFAMWMGGAIYTRYEDVTLTGSLFVGNKSQGEDGGAVAQYGSPGFLNAEGCTFMLNSAKHGGALRALTPGVIRNCIFWENSAAAGTESAQLIFTYGRTMSDCILQGGTGSAVPVYGGMTFTNIGSANPGFIHPGLMGADPAQWRTWNYRLKWSSPALNFGHVGATGAPADLDGYFPPNSLEGSPVDVGCYYDHVAGCLANLDRDAGSIVNDDDFVVFVGAYNLGVSPPANPGADLDRDGLVNDADFQLFAVAYDAMRCP